MRNANNRTRHRHTGHPPAARIASSFARRIGVDTLHSHRRVFPSSSRARNCLSIK